MSSAYCRVLKGARYIVSLCECVATYSGILAVAKSFIRQQQHSSVKLLSWCVVYLGYSVPLPWCTKVAYGVRYVVSVLVIVLLLLCLNTHVFFLLAQVIGLISCANVTITVLTAQFETDWFQFPRILIRRLWDEDVELNPRKWANWYMYSFAKTGPKCWRQ